MNLMTDTRPADGAEVAPGPAQGRAPSASSCSTAPWAPRSRRSSSTEADFRGERFAGARPRPQGQQRPADPDAAGRDPRDPPALFPRRRRHRRDQHLLRHRRSPRPTTACEAIVYELNREGARLAREAARRGRDGGRPPPLRRRRARADQPHALDLAGRQQSGLPRRHLRRAARRLRRAGARADRRRRRHHPDRDDLRHAQRQGGDLRDRGGLRRDAASSCRS